MSLNREAKTQLDIPILRIHPLSLFIINLNGFLINLLNITTKKDTKIVCRAGNKFLKEFNKKK